MNKTVLVTGGARDIGKAICLKFAENGYQVIFNYYQSESEANTTMKQLKALGIKALAVQADLTNQAGVDKLMNEATALFSSIDVLVNNTGGLVARRPLTEMDTDFIDQVMDLNFKSTVLTCRAVIPNMQPGASVVNVSSQAARDGGGGGSALYAASKAAMSSFTRSMAKEFGPSGIRVNSVCPGMIDTLFHDRFTADEVRANFEATVPLRRQGRSEDVAELVYFLATEKASFITGANYDINGGAVLS
jgi:3-oxoacyl-[acyl-carrier protein] reductase